MLHEGRLPLNEAEHAAVDKLIAKNQDLGADGRFAPVSFTRRDPEESGPLLVHVGDDTHVVTADGKTRKQRRKAGA